MKELKVSQSSNSGKSLVFGLSGVLFNQLNGLKASPERRKMIAENIFKTFDNDFLICAQNFTYKDARIFAELGPEIENRCYIDSGGFILFKKEMEWGKDDPKFIKMCESTKNRFLKMLTCIKCKECFELDNEYFRKDEDLLSPKNYLREEVKAITGFYPTPVFKMHQGFEYWKRLCESDLYPRLAIGGLAQTSSWHKYPEQLRLMVAYAKLFNKKVHFLGCQNAATFRQCQPDTVDYNITQFNITMNLARRNNPEATERELLKHFPLYSFAMAKVRSFLYDCFKREDDGAEEDEDTEE